MWTYSIEEDYTSGSQSFSVVVDSSNQFSADDQQYSVSFISMGWTGYGKFGRKYREAEYAMPADLTDLLVTQIGTFFDDDSVEDNAEITLDLSELGLNGVAVDLRKLSVHQRPDRDRELNDGVDSTSFGSVLTTIIGTEKDDYIIGSYHAETIRGGGGNDYIAGGGGDDMLFGDDGDDVISAGSGSDVINGGNGSDTLWFRYVWGSENPVGSLLAAIADEGDSTAEYFEDAQAFAELTSAYDIDPASIGIWVRMDADGDGPGSEGFAFTALDLFMETGHEDEGLQKNIFTDIENITIENYNSRSGGDEILLNSALVEGDDGDNEIITGRGDDWIFGGGGGNDTASYADSEAAVIISLMDGTAVGGFAAGDSFVDIENLIGTSRGDQLYGDDGDNVLSAGAGRDHLYGGDGDDTLYGGADQDILKGDAGTNMLFGDGGDDGFLVSEGLDIIDGGSGNDRYDATLSDGGVTINLNELNDEGYATAYGGLADGDLLKNIEQLFGSQYDDHLTGDGDTNLLEGNEGNDTLTGGGGSDILYGEAGNDTLDGGSGNDTITVGDGNDIVILNLLTGNSDVVTDFHRGDNKVRIVSDDSGSSLADYGVEARIVANSDGTTSSTELYLDTNDNGTYDLLVLRLSGFTGWDDSLHLDTSVQSDFA